MTSAIDATKPEQNSLPVSADMRANFLAAKNEIEALQNNALQIAGGLSGVDEDFANAILRPLGLLVLSNTLADNETWTVPRWVSLNSANRSWVMIATNHGDPILQLVMDASVIQDIEYDTGVWTVSTTINSAANVDGDNNVWMVQDGASTGAGGRLMIKNRRGSSRPYRVLVFSSTPIIDPLE